MQISTASIFGKSGWQMRRVAVSALIAGSALMGWSTNGLAAITFFESAGATPASITPTRDAFRTAIGGGIVAGSHGDFGGVRREINWDGVPDEGAAVNRSDPNSLPANFFNVNSPRGVVFSSPTPGASFLVSANATSATAVLFGFPGEFQPFSAQKLFATVGSRITDINFFVPGTTVAATTSAFAAIFVDVENNDAVDFTKMEFFDQSNNLIDSRNVLIAGGQGLSFLGGVASAGERISRVRITTPDNFVLSNGVLANSTTDIVVMDDFIYATPVPEPEVWAMVLAGLAIVGWRSRKRA